MNILQYYDGYDASVGISCHRRYDRTTAPWLLTISVRLMFAAGGGGEASACYPQSHAVMDDFGTLVCVRPWQ